MLDINTFTNLVSPIIVIACLMVGYILKNICTNDEVNKFIPLIVAIIGVISNIWALQTVDFNTVMIGAASGLASTGVYEAFKNLIENK